MRREAKPSSQFPGEDGDDGDEEEDEGEEEVLGEREIPHEEKVVIMMVVMMMVMVTGRFGNISTVVTRLRGRNDGKRTCKTTPS